MHTYVYIYVDKVRNGPLYRALDREDDGSAENLRRQVADHLFLGPVGGFYCYSLMVLVSLLAVGRARRAGF